MQQRGRKPGTAKTGGRRKGTPNKLTAGLKAAILGALEAKGGQRYLEKIANDDPRTFCALLGKVLPLQLQGDDDKPLKIEVRWLDPAAKSKAADR